MSGEGSQFDQFRAEVLPGILEQFADLRVRIQPLLRDLDSLETRSTLSLHEKEQIVRLQRAVTVAVQTTVGSSFLVAPVSDSRSANLVILSPDLMRLEDVYTDHETFASARAKLFQTPWSSEFVHGPDMLLPITALVEKLLAPGERLTELDKINWRKPVKHNLDMAVYTQEFPVHPEVAVDGKFRTSNNRSLYFLGIPNIQDPVTAQSVRNPYAEHSIDLSDDPRLPSGQHGLYAYNLSTPPFPNAVSQLNHSCPMRVATFLDIIAFGLLKLCDKSFPTIARGLISGMSGLSIPEDVSDSLSYGQRLVLQPLAGEELIGRSGFQLLPVEYYFPHQPRPGRVILAYTKSLEIARRHMEEQT